MQIHFPETSLNVICPYCRDALVAGPTIWCNLCGTPQHLYCWQEHNDSCSIFHCGGTETLTAPVGRKDGSSERRLIPYLVLLVLLTLCLLFGEHLIVPIPFVFLPPMLFLLLLHRIAQ